ncbi:outer membrane protein assembly factor BamB family protein [Pseudoroseicyclus sp. H15]
MKITNVLANSAAIALSMAALGTAAQADTVTYDRLSNPEPGNWLTHNYDYASHRFSPLDEINTDNVGDLKMAFTLPLMPPATGAGAFSSSLQGTPLVDNGTMYMTDGWGRVYSIDISSGDRALINWIMDPETPPEFATGILNNRGVALYGDYVYSMSPDGGFIKTDRASGEVVWRVETQQNPGEYYSMAPLALDGAIIVGPAGGDGPIRGRLEARSPEDGSVLWTFYTVPSPDEPGGETWENDAWQTGGAATWLTGSFNVDRNELVWGIGNPYPDWEPQARPGDNLYSDSTVALDAETGELNWYFQYTPNDSFDYDEANTQTLYNVEVDGEPRELLGHVGRNGFFYNIDATNGGYVSGSQYVDEVTWTDGIDSKTGLPMEYDESLAVQVYQEDTRVTESPFGGAEMEFCPYFEGGNNMFPTAYNPDLQMLYTQADEGCYVSEGLRPDDFSLQGSVSAIDVTTGQVVAKHEMDAVGKGGTLATAGGLVFGTNAAGDFYALDAETLEELWSFNVGTMIDAPPITFTVGDKQFLALPVGPGGVGIDFHDYAGMSADPQAALMSNFQKTSMMYFFSL